MELREIINRIVTGKTTKEDLITFRDYYAGLKVKDQERDAMVAALDRELDFDALHELNSDVMRHAHVLAPKDDSVFACRLGDMQFFKKLLVHEAKKAGMKAKFNDKNELQPLTLSDIPNAVLDHYATLKESFYANDARKALQKTTLDNLMSQSINFVFYAPIVKLSEEYNNLSKEEQYSLEKMLVSSSLPKQGESNKYIDGLVRERISEAVGKKTNKQTEFKNIPVLSTEAAKKKTNDIFAILSNIDATSLIEPVINSTLTKFETESRKLRKEHRSQILNLVSSQAGGILKETVKGRYYPAIVENNEKIVETVTNGLKTTYRPAGILYRSPGAAKVLELSLSLVDEVVGVVHSSLPQEEQSVALTQLARMKQKRVSRSDYTLVNTPSPTPNSSKTRQGPAR